MGVPQEEKLEKKKGGRVLNISEEIIAENFCKLGKEALIQVQEGQRVPYRINPKKNTPRHTVIKVTKNKDKERILKAARVNQGHSHRVNT